MAGEKPMNAFMVTLVDQAIQLAKSDEEANRNPTILAQRIAIGMLQARALECRTFAGLLLINGHHIVNQFPVGPMREAVRKIALALHDQQRERSRKLEAMALKLATLWPPTGDDFPPEEEKLVEVVH